MGTQERFRAWMQDEGHSLADVARLLGCGRPFVHHLRNGTRKPSLRTAARIERLTRDWPHGPIRAVAWVASEIDDSNEEGAAA